MLASSPPAQLARPAPPGGRWGREVPRHRRGGTGRPRSRGGLPHGLVPRFPPRRGRRGCAVHPPGRPLLDLRAGPRGTLRATTGPTSSSTCRTACPTCPRLATRTPVVNLVHHVHREQWPMVFGPRTARFGWWLESSLAPRVYRGRSYVTVSDSTNASWSGSASTPTASRSSTTARMPSPTRTPSAHRSRGVVVLGRLVPQKRVEIALDAVAALRGGCRSCTSTSSGRAGGSRTCASSRGPRHRGRGDLPRARLRGREAPAPGAGLGARDAEPQGGLGPRRRRGGRHGTPTVAFRARRRTRRLRPRRRDRHPRRRHRRRAGRRRLHRGPGLAAHRRRHGASGCRTRPARGCPGSGGRTASTPGSACCCARPVAEEARRVLPGRTWKGPGHPTGAARSTGVRERRRRTTSSEADAGLAPGVTADTPPKIANSASAAPTANDDGGADTRSHGRDHTSP